MALGLFLKIHFRRDDLPDFLARLTPHYFNRGGFCFAIVPAVIDDVLHLQAWFQNQHARPCRGRIALRPSREFFMNRANIEVVAFDIECGPAAFGVASLPMPLSRELYGKTQRFDVGASVDYPDGRGKRLRFADGLLIRNDARFENPFGTVLTVAGAMTGSIVLSKPASLRLELPIGVSESITRTPSCPRRRHSGI